MFAYSGMSIVISTSAMTPVRHLRAIIALRRSGRIASMLLTMSRATSSAASGTFSDDDHRDALGVDVLLVERADAERRRHRQELRRDVVGDQLDGLAGFLAEARAFGAVLVSQRPRFGLRPLRPRRLGGRCRGFRLRFLAGRDDDRGGSDGEAGGENDADGSMRTEHVKPLFGEVQCRCSTETASGLKWKVLMWPLGARAPIRTDSRRRSDRR